MTDFPNLSRHLGKWSEKVSSSFSVFSFFQLFIHSAYLREREKERTDARAPKSLSCVNDLVRE